MANIAFKLNYCDGGKRNNRRAGFYGICERGTIEYNIKTKKRLWCSDDSCDCKQYYNSIKNCTDRKTINKAYNELKSCWESEVNGLAPCYESCALRDWRIAAGSDLKSGKPRRISQLDDLLGKLCILTAERPYMSERLIFAMFIIGYTNREEDYPDEIFADENYCLEFYSDEWHKADFWSIHTNSDSTDQNWSSGLFRYFDDFEAVQFLKMAIDIKSGTDETNLAEQFLKHYCQINNIDVR